MKSVKLCTVGDVPRALHLGTREAPFVACDLSGRAEMLMVILRADGVANAIEGPIQRVVCTKMIFLPTGYAAFVVESLVYQQLRFASGNGSMQHWGLERMVRDQG